MKVFYMNRNSSDKLLFSIIGYIFILLVVMICILPFILIISGSFSNQTAILNYGYNILPRKFTLSAYQVAFLKPQAILNAYLVTIMATIAGTCFGLFITAMTGYVLSRKDFDWRNKFSFFFYFTTLFSGGLVSWYMLVMKYLKLGDSFFALVFPVMLNVFYIIIMKSFMSTIPLAISESAKLDGANDFKIFIKLILPLSKPALASLGLFIALGYWNDWFLSYMFIQNDHLFTLQFYLYKIVAGADALSKLSFVPGRDSASVPTETLKLAMTVIATGPIVFLYPFVQKYFVSGMTIGAVKG
jgi:putative aldouronate transport system permease protein